MGALYFAFYHYVARKETIDVFTGDHRTTTTTTINLVELSCVVAGKPHLRENGVQIDFPRSITHLQYSDRSSFGELTVYELIPGAIYYYRST